MYSKNDKNYWLFVESEFNRKQVVTMSLCIIN